MDPQALGQLSHSVAKEVLNQVSQLFDNDESLKDRDFGVKYLKSHLRQTILDITETKLKIDVTEFLLAETLEKKKGCKDEVQKEQLENALTVHANEINQLTGRLYGYEKRFAAITKALKENTIDEIFKEENYVETNYAETDSKKEEKKA